MSDPSRATEDPHQREALEASWHKAHGEKQVFKAIQGGMGAQEAWDTFGIL